MARSGFRAYFPGGYLTLEGGRVTSVVEKPGAGNEPSDLVNLVAHVFASWRERWSRLSKPSGSARRRTTLTSAR